MEASSLTNHASNSNVALHHFAAPERSLGEATDGADGNSSSSQAASQIGISNPPLNPMALNGIPPPNLSPAIVEPALSTLLPTLPTQSQCSLLNVPSSLVAMSQLLSQQQQQQTNGIQMSPEEQAAALALSLGANPNPQLHNLIPAHLQSLSLAQSLNGTPGYPSALIPPPQQPPPHALGTLGAASLNPLLPVAAAASGLALPTSIPLTVQDRPMSLPVYNGVNPNYPGLRVLNNSPPMFCVENFLTPFECSFLIQVAQDSFGPAPVVGKGAGEVSPSRTSSTCYLAREDVPDMMRKISLLTGKPMEHCELPQVGRYFPTQQYLQHFDAFDLSTEDGCRFASNGGQRTITVLIYLNSVMRGGATRFPALNMEVQPRQGMALVFFPATVDGLLDKMALHAALPAIDTKYVSQCWIRQSTYNGQPSKRLPATLGKPFHHLPEPPKTALVQPPPPPPLLPLAAPFGGDAATALNHLQPPRSSF